VIAGLGVTAAESGVAVGAGVIVGVWCPSHWQSNKTAELSTPALGPIPAPNRASVATHPLGLPGRPQSVVFGPRARLPPRRFKWLSSNVYIVISTASFRRDALP
jgi:hypothetical protein